MKFYVKCGIINIDMSWLLILENLVFSVKEKRIKKIFFGGRNMELKKFVVGRMISLIGKLLKIGSLLALPFMVLEFISKRMNLDEATGILIVAVGYIVIFVVVSFFEHYKSAKKYMEEHNVSPEVAWNCTKPHSDEFEA